MTTIGVASRSFSKHPVLREELLKRYPNTRFNDDGASLNGESLVRFLSGCTKAITALEVIDESILSQLPELKVIGKYGVGLDMIDLHALKKYDVQLGWTGGVNKRSVAELVISSAIALLHKSVYGNTQVKAGEWFQIRGRQLTECTFGIIGCGHIGKDIVKLLQPFNCRILVHDIRDFPEFYARYHVTPVGLNELLTSSDVITLHLPLDHSTRNFINQERMNLIKRDAVVINMARGGLIDEAALKLRIKENTLAGAALDVLEVEPPVDRELINLDNVLVTPHIGGSTEEAVLAMGMAAIEGLDNAKDPLTFLSFI